MILTFWRCRILTGTVSSPFLFFQPLFVPGSFVGSPVCVLRCHAHHLTTKFLSCLGEIQIGYAGTLALLFQVHRLSIFKGRQKATNKLREDANPGTT